MSVARHRRTVSILIAMFGFKAAYGAIRKALEGEFLFEANVGLK